MAHDVPRSIVPPYLARRVRAHCSTREGSEAGHALGDPCTAIREGRAVIAAMQLRSPVSAAPGGVMRQIFTMEGEPPSRWKLPGRLLRSEGGPATGRADADSVYDLLGTAGEFMQKVLRRNSVDNHGMALVASLDFGTQVHNAFWEGRQLLFGTPDGGVFDNLTSSLDVVVHELGHGIQSFECNPVPIGQPGALAEHFSDVLGCLADQWKNDQTADQASWLIGASLLRKFPGRLGLRSLKEPGKAFIDDPVLGTDPQCARLAPGARSCHGSDEPHVNCGVPNHAFYLAAAQIGGYAWGPNGIGQVWYQAIQQLWPSADFTDCANVTMQIAAQRYGAVSREARAVRSAWQAVGVPFTKDEDRRPVPVGRTRAPTSLRSRQVPIRP